MQKSTLSNFIDSLDIYEMKAMGCHIEKHIGNSDEALIKRAKTDKNEDGTKIKGATTFDISEEEIIGYAKKALHEFEDELIEWLDDYSDGSNYQVFIDCGKVIGHGYFNTKGHDWNTGSFGCSQILIIIRKDYRKYDTFFKFITCYAEPNVKENKILHS